MFHLGLMGGATYANCMHLLNTDVAVPDDLRELAINLSFTASNVGIIGSSLAVLALDTTVMSDEQGFMYPDGRGCGA